VALDRTLELLPSTLRKANTTFVNLRATLDDLDRLVAESKPATRELAPFLRELRPLVDEARPTVADLRRLIRTPGANNDLIELTAKQPRLAQLTSTVFPRAIRTLDRAQPVFEYVRGYTPDLTSWISNFGQLAASYDANGHYARVQPMFLPSTFSGGTLTAADPAEKLSGFDAGVLTRCPGAIVQPPPDGSAPVPLGGCDPSTTPPGP
jgi:phospholipid/cholesterol/gamma-HCH transport system substrate-binding protein